MKDITRTCDNNKYLFLPDNNCIGCPSLCTACKSELNCSTFKTGISPKDCICQNCSQVVTNMNNWLR